MVDCQCYLTSDAGHKLPGTLFAESVAGSHDVRVCQITAKNSPGLHVRSPPVGGWGGAYRPSPSRSSPAASNPSSDQ